ncbi:MAG: oxidoreductase [Gammaproteobacteria bacterium]|nr:oxidoreductase [Gammaproteobacteria bacterium]
MEEFKAYRIHQDGKSVHARFEDRTLRDLGNRPVLVRVRYSGINFKDALAATGAGKILRSFPLTGGIDLAGDVVESSDTRFHVGQTVLVTGCGLGEEVDGGYSEYARVDGDWVIPIPEGFDARDAMTLGTAGFTAALAIHRMERNGQNPERGPVVVTGASGGVGSVAVDMLAGAGYEVIAISGKKNAASWLRQIGADKVLDRNEVEFGARPMETALWGGAIDNVGGDMLAWLTRTVNWWGNIASVGLAGSHELHTTVMPFILRGVSILGINSVKTARDERKQVWARIASDLRPRHLDAIRTSEIDFAELPGAFEDFLGGRVRGRTVVRINA